MQPRDFAGVFTVDRAIHVLQAYAAPSEAVHLAIDRAASRAGMPLRRAGVVPGAEYSSGESGQPTPETRDEAKRPRGMATLDALDRLIRGLALLHGRKTVVLFSEGLALDASEETTQLPRADGPQPMDDTWLTDGRFERFQRLVEAANAAQVAFYTFDAAGLRVESPFAAPGFGRPRHVPGARRRSPRPRHGARQPARRTRRHAAARCRPAFFPPIARAAGEGPTRARRLRPRTGRATVSRVPAP